MFANRRHPEFFHKIESTVSAGKVVESAIKPEVFSNHTFSPELESPKPLSDVSSVTITKNPLAGIIDPVGNSFFGFVPLCPPLS